MFGLVGYFMLCLLVAGVLTVLLALFRPIKKQDEFRSWRWTAGLFAVCAALPYSYAEFMTRSKGQEMRPAVEEVIPDAEIKGDLAYYKVWKSDGKQAEIIGVANDQNVWGLRERVVFLAKLKHEGRNWNLEHYEILNSDKRKLDGSSFPPYW